jgi:hypothetical protein
MFYDILEGFLMDSATEILILEIAGGIIGLGIFLWFWIKPMFQKDKEKWQCEYCNKIFKDSKKCQEHEKTCSKIKK